MTLIFVITLTRDFYEDFGTKEVNLVPKQSLTSRSCVQVRLLSTIGSQVLFILLIDTDEKRNRSIFI